MGSWLTQLDPRIARMLAFALLTICVAALGSYLLWPMLKEVRETADNLTLLQRVAGNGGAVDRDIRDAQDRVSSLQKLLHGDMVNKSSHELESFVLGRMQNISWHNKVELRKVKPAKGGQVLDFEEVKFDVEVKGQYFDLFNWIRDLNNELGFVVVNKFHMRAATQSEIEPDLVATFTIVSYRGSTDA